MTNLFLTSEAQVSIQYADIEGAAVNLAGIAHRTPVLTSKTVNKQTNCQAFFKCENLQRAGSFKFRGAYNALSQLKAEEQGGVLTFSSGNHGQAIALSGQLLQIPTTVVMPDDAPQVKQAATRAYGAQVILYNRATTPREELAKNLATTRQLTIIPPYDHPDIIAGQGTAVKELIEEVGHLDVILVCCGGGGLLSGSAIAAKTLLPNCRVIGVEPAQADDATRSFYTKTLQTIDNPQTIADGARTPSLGKLTFPLILNYVDEMVTVSESAILKTMFFLWERLKIVVEPTGVLAATALIEGVVSLPNDAKVGIILTGGNVDLKNLAQLFANC